MRVLNFNDLKQLKGIPFSSDHVRRLVKKGRFPKPVKLGPGNARQARNVWVEEEIDKYLADRLQERDGSRAATV